MTVGPAAALVVLLTLAAVLLVSGVAKLRDRRATRDAFDALRVPSWIPAGPAASSLPWAEIVLAVALLVLPSPLAAAAAVAVLLLMLSYTTVIGRALTFDEPVTCSCFGSIGRHDVDWLTLARNVLLTALAGAATWFTLDGGSGPGAAADLDTAGWSVLLAAAAAAAVSVLVTGGVASTAHPAPPVDPDDLEYERRPIPYGRVSFADGSSSTLAELARKQAHLLVILNYGCGPCVRIANHLDDWARQLSPAVEVLAVYPDPDNLGFVDQHSADLAAWEPDLNVRQIFDVGAPAAILIGADGLLAGGPVVGEDEVEALITDITAELTVGGGH